MHSKTWLPVALLLACGGSATGVGTSDIVYDGSCTKADCVTGQDCVGNFCTSCAAPADGTLFVDPTNGSDFGTGAAGCPLKTIKRALLLTGTTRTSTMTIYLLGDDDTDAGLPLPAYVDLEGAVAIEVDSASRLPPVPVIGLVGVEAPSRLKALVNLGATSFLRKPVHGGAVYTSLFMGVNQFLLRSDMYSRLQDLEERRRGRRAVVRAIILLMQSGLDEDTAYTQLRRESMRMRQSLEIYCEGFLSRRARPPDKADLETSITLRGSDKQAM